MNTVHAPIDVASIEPISHDEATGLARATYQRFADHLARVGDDEWELPTDCTGWTVRDLGGHMVGAMRSAASMRELASQQLAVKRRARREGGNETDLMTAIQVERAAGLDPAELVAECRDLVGAATAGRRRTPALLRRHMRFPVELRDEVERWTLGYLVDVILTRDAWLHRVDLALAVGRDPEVEGDDDHRLVADVVAEWARRHGQPFTLTLSGPAGGTFRSGEPGAGEAIELDTVAFCRTLSGRADGTGLLAVEVPF